MKCALSEAKDRKIQSLHQQQALLQAELEQLLGLNELQAEKQKQNKLRISSLTMQLQVEQMRNQVLIVSVGNMDQQMKQLEKGDSAVNEQLREVQTTYAHLNLQLFQLQKHRESYQSLLQRMRKQVKMFTNVGQSNSLLKSCENVRKTNQCLKRTLAVFQNKLESHKKYLAILRKKQEKQQKEQNEKIQQKEQGKRDKVSSSKAMSSTNLKVLWKQDKTNCEISNQQASMQKIDRTKAKQFSELTRKKNQMLMQSKK